MKRLALLASAILLHGCAPGLETTTFLDRPPRPQSHEVMIYQEKAPDCEYEEVGSVEAEQRTRLHSNDDLLASLRDAAREMGGDAIVGLSADVKTDGAVVTSDAVLVSQNDVLSGTVVRFTEEECLR